jgi:hypothetical protein
VLKPGCAGIPSFNHTSRLQLTLLFLLLASLLFFLACTARMLVQRRRAASAVCSFHSRSSSVNRTKEKAALRKNPPSQHAVHFAAVWADWRQRLVHSQLTCLAIFYLRLTTLLFQSIPCALLPAPAAPSDSQAVPTYNMYLVADGQTRCYQGEHLWTLMGSCVLLLVYTVGLPLGCFVLLARFRGRRGNRVDGLTTPEHAFSAQRADVPILTQESSSCGAIAEVECRCRRFPCSSKPTVAASWAGLVGRSVRTTQPHEQAKQPRDAVHRDRC